MYQQVQHVPGVPQQYYNNDPSGVNSGRAGRGYGIGGMVQGSNNNYSTQYSVGNGSGGVGLPGGGIAFDTSGAGQRPGSMAPSTGMGASALSQRLGTTVGPVGTYPGPAVAAGGGGGGYYQQMPAGQGRGPPHQSNMPGCATGPGETTSAAVGGGKQTAGNIKKEIAARKKLEREQQKMLKLQQKKEEKEKKERERKEKLERRASSAALDKQNVGAQDGAERPNKRPKTDSASGTVQLDEYGLPLNFPTHGRDGMPLPLEQRQQLYQQQLHRQQQQKQQRQEQENAAAQLQIDLERETERPDTEQEGMRPVASNAMAVPVVGGEQPGFMSEQSAFSRKDLRCAVSTVGSSHAATAGVGVGCRWEYAALARAWAHVAVLQPGGSSDDGGYCG